MVFTCQGADASSALRADGCQCNLEEVASALEFLRGDRGGRSTRTVVQVEGDVVF